MRTSRRLASAAGGAVVALVLTACTSGSPAADPPSSRSSSPSGSAAAAAPGAGNWLGYHADQARTGAVGDPSPTGVSAAWAADLGGAVRGQPLVAGGRVFAATETNRVVALDPADGKVIWSTSLGTPLTDVEATAGCGNIDPLGVTSTPVVDPTSNTLFVVAEISEGDSVHHRLFGLDLDSGTIRTSADVDPPLPSGETPVHLLQRASLALGNGRVYVPYGGNIGDCGHYHGWVVGADISDPTKQVSFEVAPDGEGGAIWQSGGAPALDAAGNVYVSTGNANPFPDEGGPDPLRYAESVVKLSPDLQVLADFKDPTAGGDQDLSTGNPVLLPDGRVFAVGKTDTAFFLDGSDLHRLAAVRGVCDSDPDGGPAYDPASNRVFVPCRDGGLQVVEVDGPALGPRLDGADSAPVVIGGTVWAVNAENSTLNAFDAATGHRVESVDIGTDVPVFESPSFGAGLLLVATEHGVTAFR